LYKLNAEFVIDMINESVKVVLFDLGNVVIYLDEEASYKSFAKLGEMTLDQLKKQVSNVTFFDDFERGHISDESFRTNIRELLGKQSLQDSEIDDAWNAMLIKIDPAFIRVLESFGKEKTIMVLSNTNIIHERAFHIMLKDVCSYTHLNQLFDKVYLSHEIHERKPDAAAWEFILDDNPGLIAEEILFLDDKIENLNAASEMKIQVKQIHNPGETLDLLQ